MNIKYAGPAKQVKPALRQESFGLPILERTVKMSMELIGIVSASQMEGKDIILRLMHKTAIVQGEEPVWEPEVTQMFQRTVEQFFSKKAAIYQILPGVTTTCTTCRHSRQSYLEYGQVEDISGTLNMGTVHSIVIGETLDTIYAGVVDVVGPGTGVAVITAEGIKIHAPRNSRVDTLARSFVAEGAIIL